MTAFKRLQFNSLAELGSYCRNTKSVTGDSSQRAPGHSWDLGCGFDGAMDILAKGGKWQEGADKIKAAMIEQAPAMRLETTPELTRQITGGSVCVGAYLQGNPACMYRRKPAPVISQPILKIGINIAAAGGLKADRMVNLGAAWMSVIQELESQGYRCDVRCFEMGGHGASNAKPQREKGWTDWSVKIKAPDQPFNPVACAFMIAHPANLRRIGFKVAETVPEWKPTVDHGYGSCRNTPLTDREFARAYDLYTPMQTLGKEIATPLEALEYVQATVTEQLATLS